MTNGEVRVAAIATYGDTIHTFVERANYNGVFLPGFRPVEDDDPVARPAGLKHIDHIVGNVGWGEMNRWVDFYRDVMGFRLFKHFDDKDISTEYSALMSKVMSNGNERVKFPINEPAKASGNLKSKSIWISITDPACSTSRSRPTTSSIRCRSCGCRALNFCACPRLIMTTCWRGSGRSTNRSS